MKEFAEIMTCTPDLRQAYYEYYDDKQLKSLPTSKRSKAVKDIQQIHTSVNIFHL